MSGKGIGHTAIFASAGSGKTFALSHRYIGLLARGVPPERIVALTFTRKAAGEIFDSIVGHLCRAAVSDRDAARTSEIIGHPLTKGGFLEVTGSLLARLHRVRVGTLDSFLAGVLRTYAERFGVDADFTLFESQGQEAGALHLRVLEAVLGRGRGNKERSALLAEIRRATFGREEKGLARILDETLRDCQETFRQAPAKDLWGGEEALWGGPSPWLGRPGDVPTAAAGVVGHAAGERRSGEITPGAEDRWVRFAREASSWQAGSTWAPGLDYLFGKLAPHLDALAGGSVEIVIDRRKYLIPPELGRQAAVLARHVIRTELESVMERTAGLHRLISRYEQEYGRRMIREGRFSFDDAQHLLRPEGQKRMLGLRAEGGEGINLEHRLESPLEHWLLDEFQDTGEGQWDVFAHLAEEVIRDPAGKRSFFFVGDVKQAIYGWRGGNPKLFTGLRDRYAEVVREETLEKSYRSCGPVIATVNRVFRSLQVGDLPQEALRYWRSLWKDHTYEPAAVPARGYAAILEPTKGREGGKPAEEDRFRAVAAIVSELRPGRRGLSVGVLVRRNVTGRLLTDLLRRECPLESIVHEGTAAILDNPVTALLLSLVRYAHHPGDTFALKHLQMSPLRGAVESLGLGAGTTLPSVLLRQMQEGGFGRFVRDWGKRLDEVSPLDDFGRRRLDDMASAALEFDRDGGGGGDDFAAFVAHYGRKDLAAADSVRIMTVHQAKGLDFDAVILPDLQGTGGGFRGSAKGVVASRERDANRVRWVLAMPRRSVALCDEVLRSELERRDEEASFEELCVLYVALTRAKAGLYLVTSHPGDSSRAVTPASIVKARLAPGRTAAEGAAVTYGGEVLSCLYEEGEREWYMSLPVRPAAVETRDRAGGESPPAAAPRRRRLERVVPSAQEGGRFTASWLFDRASREVLLLGGAVHEVLRLLEWIEGFDLPRELDRWEERTALPDSLRREVREHVTRCLGRKEVRRALERPREPVELWREKRFETTLGDRWLSGIFDRVVIRRGSGSDAHRGEIIDYKSDAVKGPDDVARAVERYRAQMMLYRQALAHMLGIGEEAVSAKLIFTFPGEVRDLAGHQCTGDRRAIRSDAEERDGQT